MGFIPRILPTLAVLAACAGPTDDRPKDEPPLELPEDFPELRLETLGEPADGAWFLGVWGPTNLALILDSDGTPLWHEASDFPTYDLRASPDGSITYVRRVDAQGPRIAFQLDADFDLVRTWEAVPLTSGAEVFLDHHDFQVLENGNALMLGLTPSVEDTRPWGGTVAMDVLHNTIQEVTPEGEVVWEWVSFGEIDLDDVSYWSQTVVAEGWEYAHVNSLEIDPEDGHLVISVRHTNEVLKIARTTDTLRGRTFQPGEVMWRLGGPSSDFEVDDPRPDGGWGFAAQHTARPVPGGVIVYDNSMRAVQGGAIEAQNIQLTDAGFSRYVEYALDMDEMRATARRSYELTGSEATLSMGSAQRIEGGHTVIGWGSLARDSETWPVATEVDADDLAVQHLWIEQGAHTYRAAKHVRRGDRWVSP